jgi:hypothetical protein
MEELITARLLLMHCPACRPVPDPLGPMRVMPSAAKPAPAHTLAPCPVFMNPSLSVAVESLFGSPDVATL